ncbi:MAG: 50S ribosomal protein L4 [Candidatus Poribacteria bacterium]|nr:50S ribosomal protein L4 [Candidatus Poribacteria bacterium]MDE0504649.1 50S ribosomal protein L4 [Candidatus Poribacteria bacterium]
MATYDVYNRSGEVVNQKELSDRFTDAPVNTDVLHQCVVAYLANRRSGTASTKNRAAVKTSGRKLHRQKGTGRARVGDAGSPIRVHGGVAFGPNLRSYHHHVPKKVRKLGLCSALVDKFQNGQCVLIDSFTLDRPKTKDVVQLIDTLGLEGKLLLVLDQRDQNVQLSVRNIPHVSTCIWDVLNVYDVLAHDRIVITESAAEKLEGRFFPPTSALNEQMSEQ